MKYILPIAVLAIVFTACSGNGAKVADSEVTLTDTAGYAAFQEWKQEQQIISILEEREAEKAEAEAKAAAAAPVRTVVVRQPASNPTWTNSTESSHAAKPPQKKGWSKAAKGAVIGGVVGAGAGAIINKKNRAVGAVIGGVVGAAGGYGIGRGMDKRDGRVQ